MLLQGTREISNRVDLNVTAKEKDFWRVGKLAMPTTIGYDLLLQAH